MTHEDGFLQDIVQNPEDDTPRLIFADWLDDHHQPDRAEFIHVQIELAHLAADDPQRVDLAEREAGLLAEHGESWRAPLRVLGVSRTEFRRGLVESVQLDGAPAASHLREVFQTIPVRELRLWRTDASTVASPFAVGLRELSLCGCDVGNKGAEALAESPHLVRLRTLALYRNGIDPSGAGRALRKRFGDRVDFG